MANKEIGMESKVTREEAKRLTRELRKALDQDDIGAVHKLCTTILTKADPRSLLAFPVETLPGADNCVPQVLINPEQEKMEKLYANVATNIWRIKNQILDAEENHEPKESLSEREVAKIARYINSLEVALRDGGVEVISDFIGKPHREGSALKVVSYEERQDLTQDEYVEVLLPTVRWTNSEGQTYLLQPAEVVVGRPKNPQPESELQTV